MVFLPKWVICVCISYITVYVCVTKTSRCSHSQTSIKLFNQPSNLSMYRQGSLESQNLHFLSWWLVYPTFNVPLAIIIDHWGPLWNLHVVAFWKMWSVNIFGHTSIHRNGRVNAHSPFLYCLLFICHVSLYLCGCYVRQQLEGKNNGCVEGISIWLIQYNSRIKKITCLDSSLDDSLFLYFMVTLSEFKVYSV